MRVLPHATANHLALHNVPVNPGQNQEKIRTGSDLVENNRIKLTTIDTLYVHENINIVCAKVLEDCTSNERTNIASVTDKYTIIHRCYSLC
jgi:hypothetical protein